MKNSLGFFKLIVVVALTSSIGVNAMDTSEKNGNQRADAKPSSILRTSSSMSNIPVTDSSSRRLSISAAPSTGGSQVISQFPQRQKRSGSMLQIYSRPTVQQLLERIPEQYKINIDSQMEAPWLNTLIDTATRDIAVCTITLEELGQLKGAPEHIAKAKADSVILVGTLQPIVVLKDRPSNFRYRNLRVLLEDAIRHIESNTNSVDNSTEG